MFEHFKMKNFGSASSISGIRIFKSAENGIDRSNALHKGGAEDIQYG